MKIRIAVILFVLAANCFSQPSTLKVAVYQGASLKENAFLIRNRNHLVLIDALGSDSAAHQIVMETQGEKLAAILITHGHPDHFLGLATILKAHPESVVYVADDEIKNYIMRYVNMAMSKRLLDDAPLMQPAPLVADGFKYESIQVIESNKLNVGEGKFLLIKRIVDAAESTHHTILYNEQLKVFFPGDLLYNDVFNWLGPGANQQSIKNWVSILGVFKRRFGDPDLVIYPGHGDPGDRTLFDRNINYLKAFQEIVCHSRNRADAVKLFRAIYPNYNGEFLLTKSIDHWIDSCSEKNTIIPSNIQDLTHTLTPDFPFIPVPGITFPFGIKPIATFEKHGVRANQWIIHEHIGTQMDAPNHFVKDGVGLEAIDVRELVVPVIVIDISQKCTDDPDAELSIEDIKRWESSHGRIPESACVMMYSGWEQYLYDERYLGIDEKHVKHFPGISHEAIQFLISERDIAGVGVDVISIDPGYDHQYQGHKILLGAGKWALEAVANLKKIPASGAWLFVGAPKVKGATGGPTRLIALWK